MKVPRNVHLAAKMIPDKRNWKLRPENWTTKLRQHRQRSIVRHFNLSKTNISEEIFTRWLAMKMIRATLGFFSIAIIAGEDLSYKVVVLWMILQGGGLGGGGEMGWDIIWAFYLPQTSKSHFIIRDPAPEYTRLNVSQPKAAMNFKPSAKSELPQIKQNWKFSRIHFE